MRECWNRGHETGTQLPSSPMAPSVGGGVGVVIPFDYILPPDPFSFCAVLGNSRDAEL